MHLRILLILLLSVLFATTHAQNVTVSGFVKDANSGEALIGSTVINLRNGQGTVSNSYGFYSLTQKKDSLTLRISYVGYETRVFSIAPKRDTTLQVFLKPNITLEEFTVTGYKEEAQYLKTQMSTIDVSMEMVKNLPVFLGEVDLLKTLQLLPGVQSGNEGTSGLYVRGGGPDQNLILLDGVPVYNASHLFGFFSIFNADAINNVQLIKGGFPARYGGRLSSVIDIRMKEGNMQEYKGEFSVGLIASKFTFEGPLVKDKTSFILSARRTYLDILARPFIALADDSFRAGYYFYDFNFKINHKFSDRSRLYFSNYFGDDIFFARGKDEFTAQGTTFTDEFKNNLSWGNIISALRWNYIINPKLFSNTTLTYSRYRFNVGSEFTEQARGVQNYNDFFSFDYFSGIRDWGAKVDFDYLPAPNHYIKFGLGNIYHTFTPGINQFIQRESGIASIDTAFGSLKQYAHELYWYFEDEIKVNDKLNVNAGFHQSLFFVGSKTYHTLQPRISARYLVGEKSSLKASYASMAQFLHLLSNTGIGLPTDLWLPATEQIGPQQSNITAVGYATALSRKFDITVEAFYKHMDGLIEYREGVSFLTTSQDWQNLVEVGRGWAYGTEFLIEKKLGKTTGWIGYTLSWAERQFNEINFGEVFPYRFDRRHDIGLAITHKFSETFDVGIVGVYGTGNAVTLALERYRPLPTMNNLFVGEIEHIDSRNNYRMPAYARVDIGFNFRKQLTRGERTWSFSLYNALNRQNPFFLYFGNNDNGDRVLKQVALFPIIPAVNYSYKF
ncbi:MAG: TonB-dependent receptor [Luteibaculaceae bacterium]